jgi:RsiW-degrading membrane proteinase PrsW (M82 family)
MWAIYLAFSAVLAIVGYFIGKRMKGDSDMWAAGGFILGLMLSVAAWFLFGKKYVKNHNA